MATGFSFNTSSSSSSPFASSSSPFGSSMSNPSFGTSSTGSSFGFATGSSAATTPSVTVGTTSPFGSGMGTGSTIFGANSGSGTSTNLFGSSVVTPSFGSSATTASSASTGTTPPFGSGAVATSNVFGASSDSGSSTNLFGASLGSGSSTNLFGSASSRQTTTSVSSSMFGATTSFGTSTPSGSSSGSSSLFGTGSSFGSSGFSSSSGTVGGFTSSSGGTTSVTVSAAQTSSAPIATTSSGTTLSTSAASGTSPKLPPEITGKTIKEEWNAEEFAEEQGGQDISDSIFAEEEDQLQTDAELMAERERVEAWRNWRMSDYDTLANGISVMRFEEEFALNWLGTNSIDEATRLPFINEVFTQKLVEKMAKGKEKVPEQQIENPADEERTYQTQLKEPLILSAEEESTNISLNPETDPQSTTVERPQSETLVNPESNPRSELETADQDDDIEADRAEVAVIANQTDDTLARVLTTLNDVMNRMKSLEENQIELGKQQKLIKADTKKISEIEDKVNDIYDIQLHFKKILRL